MVLPVPRVVTLLQPWAGISEYLRRFQVHLGSDGFAATTAELGSGGITAATFATEHLDRFGCAPVERGGANRNSAPSAKLCAG